MDIRHLFAQEPKIAQVLALDSDVLITPDIAAIAPATTMSATLAHLLVNLGPFFTSDGQMASHCATAFDDAPMHGDVA